MLSAGIRDPLMSAGRCDEQGNREVQLRAGTGRGAVETPEGRLEGGRGGNDGERVVSGTTAGHT